MPVRDRAVVNRKVGLNLCASSCPEVKANEDVLIDKIAGNKVVSIANNGAILLNKAENELLATKFLK